VEVSPHPALLAAIEDTGGTAVGSLRRDQPGPDIFLTNLAQAHTYGADLDWATLNTRPGHVDLPTYPFQHENFWPHSTVGVPADVAAAGLRTADHPLLGAMVAVAGSDSLMFTGRLSLKTHPWLSDHAVEGTVLLPGTAFVDLAVHVGDRVGCSRVDELTLRTPLVLPSDGAVELQLAAGAPDETGRRSLTLHARPEDAPVDQPWTCHATGTLAPGNPSRPAEVASRPSDAVSLEVDGAYRRFAAAGYQYGPAFQGLRSAWQAGDDVHADVRLPEGLDAALFTLHPALFDAALHALHLVHDTGAPALPFTWTGVTVHATGATAVSARLHRHPDDTIDITLTDPAGQLVATVEALAVRPAAVPSAADRSLLRLEWTSLPQDATAAPARWAVTGDPGLAEGLRAAGLTVTAYEKEQAPDLVLWAPSAITPREAAAETLAMLHDWLAGEQTGTSRLAVVTQQAAGGETADEPISDTQLGLAPVWGLVRSAQSEHPDRFALADVDGSADSWRALPTALATGTDQIAIRDGVVRVPRLRWAGTSLTAPAGAAEWRLETDAPGTLERLALTACPAVTEPLGDGQIRIGVRAAGLNFRDVLISLGMYPDSTALMGSEAAGVVLDVGPGVTRFTPGDRVVGLLAGGFGPVAVTDHRMVVRMPREWSFAEAAAVPVVFLTAYYGLRDLGDLRAGESVLVHAAAGGVGMAAVQLARHWGADVYGTASPGKWDTLRELGLSDDHIASSRDLSFEPQFGHVDLVLNSLAREYVDASLRLLGRGGRLIEMGKTDIRDADRVAADHPGVRYRAFDLVEAGPDRIGEMLTEVLDLFERGVLRPIPVTAWDVRRAPEAFRHLGQARHVGKMVLTVPAPIDPAGTVLITGGTGTLGALTARHLITRHGVRHLLLTGRKGPDAPGANALRGELTALGATVTIAACDITDRAALAALLDTVAAEHPLTAVVHAAGALDDATLTAQTPGHLDRVLPAKADAAHHLHELTRDLDLRSFVLFSSAAAAFGAPGQANYAAANTYLDALARHRHSLGLPATSIAWGLWADASAMTGHLTDADLRRLRRAGLPPLSAEQGLALLDAALAAADPHVIALRVDPSGDNHPPLVRDLLQAPRRRTAGTTGDVAGPLLAQRLAGLAEDARDQFVLREVQAQIAAVLGHASAGTVTAERSFKDFGFDSLLAVELRNRLNRVTGLRLPATLVFDHPTPAALARWLRAEVTPDKPDDGDLLAELDRLKTRLVAHSGDETSGVAVTARLKDLLAAWTEARPANGGPGDGDEVPGQLRTASDDELFDFIDGQLGATGPLDRSDR
ncbi:SDR family NAD(P)-dependent oxidoreductase, partial [Micromonospora sp. DT201]|uniref:SDR family NAD(P)-dependent oxidoreductase n=1 Tax=Micromonospora sp. DT201 TaxID=3393442 RepID=UPI003CF6C72D